MIFILSLWLIASGKQGSLLAHVFLFCLREQRQRCQSDLCLFRDPRGKHIKVIMAVKYFHGREACTSRGYPVEILLSSENFPRWLIIFIMLHI